MHIFLQRDFLLSLRWNVLIFNHSKGCFSQQDLLDFSTSEYSTVREDTVSQDTVSQDTVSQDTVRQYTVSQYTVSQYTVSQYTVSQYRIHWDGLLDVLNPIRRSNAHLF